MAVAVELRLHCWPDYGCGDEEGDYRMPSRFASSVDMGTCQHGPCQPARFCRKSLHQQQQQLLLHASCCMLLLLLVAAAVAAGAAVAQEYTRALPMMHPSVSPAKQATLSQTGKKSGLRNSRGKLGQSKASGEFSANKMQRSNLVSPIYGSTMICFPNMSNLRIFEQFFLGFAIT